MKRIGWIILPLALLMSDAMAQSSSVESLSWAQCLEQTRVQNPDLIAARAAIREAEYRVVSANSAFLPQLTASAGISRGQNEMNDDWMDTKSASGRLSLSQDLFSGGGNVASRRKAVAQLRVVNEQYRKTLSDVELRTRLAFIEVLYARDLAALTQQIAERRRNNVRLINLRFDGGRENAGSLARSKAQLAQAEYEVREAERAMTYALRNLSAAMGQQALSVGVAGMLQAQPPEALNDLVGLAHQTPDYVIAETQVEAAKEGLKVARSSLFPQISFNLSTGLSSGDYENYDGSWSAGLNASVPLYVGGRNRSAIAASREQIVQSEMGLLKIDHTLLASLQQDWNTYINAVESEVVQKQLYDAETLRAEISTAKYKQGLLDYQDWDTIENNLISQGKSHLQARRSAEMRQAYWKNALGTSVWYEQGRIQ